MRMVLKGKAAVQRSSRCSTSRRRCSLTPTPMQAPLVRFHSRKVEGWRLVMGFNKLPTLRLSSDGPMRLQGAGHLAPMVTSAERRRTNGQLPKKRLLLMKQ